MSHPNFYDILGVPQNANDDEIKKAYRKLSFIHHPDKNKSPESTQMFQKLAEAYSILSDPARRQQYDMELKFGKMGGGFGGGGGGTRMYSAEINPHDIFNMFFGKNQGDGGLGGLGGLFHSLSGMGGMGGMGGGFGGEIHIIHQSGNPAELFGGGGNPFMMHVQHMQRMQQQPPQPNPSKSPSPAPEPIETSVTITFEQAFSGIEIMLEYEKIVSETDVFSNVVQASTRIAIPKGVRNGEVISISGIGNTNADGVSGILNVTVCLAPHPAFSTIDTDTVSAPISGKSPLDLFYHKTVSLKESLCGFQFEFTHLNGKTYQIVNKNIGSVIQPESIKTIKGLGFERLRHSSAVPAMSEVGCLHICFHVAYPETLPEDVQTALSTILP